MTYYYIYFPGDYDNFLNLDYDSGVMDYVTDILYDTHEAIPLYNINGLSNCIATSLGGFNTNDVCYTYYIIKVQNKEQLDIAIKYNNNTFTQYYNSKAPHHNYDTLEDIKTLFSYYEKHNQHFFIYDMYERIHNMFSYYNNAIYFTWSDTYDSSDHYDSDSNDYISNQDIITSHPF